MDKAAFYKSARKHLGPLSQSQVDGFELFLDEAASRATQINKFAYILATAWWETARTMQPVREAFYIAPGSFEKAEQWRKKHLRYYPYYGRGYVQLTWDFNYARASKEFGVDFVADPDAVMEPRNAIRITFQGMEEGWFTSKALDDFIDDIDENDAKEFLEYREARRVINGKDKRDEIARIALAFEADLSAAGY